MLQGIVPAMVTPVEGTQVQYDTLRTYTDWLVGRGVDGLFALGTTGEGLMLSRDAWVQALSTIVEVVNNRCPVAVQCGGISLEDTNWRIRAAVDVGADCVALMTPFFYQYEQEALERYFAEVIGRWPDVKFYLYNIPRYANNTISPELFGRLAARFDNVLGIKDSSGSIGSLRAFVHAAPHRTVLSGSDATLKEAFELGAKGVVSGIAAALPDEVLRAWDALRSGDSSGAEQIKRVQQVFHKVSTIASAKAVLASRGLMSAACLPPRMSVSDDQRESLEDALRTLGITVRDHVRGGDGA